MATAIPTWSSYRQQQPDPIDSVSRGLLGSNAVLGNPWMEDWLLKRGATNLMPQKPPSLAEGAGEVFKNLGLKRKPKGMFTQEEQFGDDSGFTNQNSNSKRGGMAEGPYGYGSEDDKELTIDGKPLSAYSWSGLKSSATSPINTAKTGGMFGNLVGGLLGDAIGSGFGAYSGSHAVDDAIAQSTGYNPDVSAWSQFFNSLTGGLFGRSGSDQQQDEYDAFSGMDNVFGDDDDDTSISQIESMIADAQRDQNIYDEDMAYWDSGDTGSPDYSVSDPGVDDQGQATGQDDPEGTYDGWDQAAAGMANAESNYGNEDEDFDNDGGWF